MDDLYHPAIHDHVDPEDRSPSMDEQERMVEAILFATPEPMTVPQIRSRLPHGCDPVAAIAGLVERYDGRGVRLARVGNAWAFRTAPDLGYLMQPETVVQRKLSRAAVETLAIIAYHQPVTRADIEQIRGVTVSRGTIDILLELGWIKLGQRRESPGRPVTFVITSQFLDHFGLSSPRDLPGLKELRETGLLEGQPAVRVTDEAGQDETEQDETPESVDQDRIAA